MSTPSRHFTQWVRGQLVGFAQLNELNEAALDLSGALPDVLLGTQDLQAGDQPLLVAVGANNVVTVGGPNQQCVLRQRVVNESFATSFIIPINTGGTARQDAIIGQPIEGLGFPYATKVRNSDRSISNFTANRTMQGATYQYVQGPAPLVPSGFALIAYVNVPNGRSLIQSDVVVQLPTFTSLVNSLIASAVAALPAAPGAPTINSPGGTMSVNLASNNYSIDNPNLISLNSMRGTAFLESLDGSIGITPDGANKLSLTLAKAVVAVLGGLSGNIGFVSTDGNVGIVTNGNNLNFTFARAVVNTIGGLSGALGFSSTDGSVSVGTLGNNLNFTVPVGRVGDTLLTVGVLTSAGTLSLSLPPLPIGIWRLRADFNGNNPTGGNITMNGYGTAWNGNISIDDTPADEVGLLVGSGSTGQIPAVQITCSVTPTRGFQCALMAVRAS